MGSDRRNRRSAQLNAFRPGQPATKRTGLTSGLCLQPFFLPAVFGRTGFADVRCAHVRGIQPDSGPAQALPARGAGGKDASCPRNARRGLAALESLSAVFRHPLSDLPLWIYRGCVKSCQGAGMFGLDGEGAACGRAAEYAWDRRIREESAAEPRRLPLRKQGSDMLKRRGLRPPPFHMPAELPVKSRMSAVHQPSLTEATGSHPAGSGWPAPASPARPGSGSGRGRVALFPPQSPRPGSANARPWCWCWRSSGC